MSRECTGYRETLADILEFTGGKRMLTVKDVKSYTGFADDRTVKKRFPFTGSYLAATMLALCLSGGAAT